MSLTVLKVFLIDLAGLEGVLRALSFLGLGAALIGIGLVYQKLVFARVPDAEAKGLRRQLRCDRRARNSSKKAAPLTDTPADIAKLPFEAALAELEAIVEKLEKGAVALEESIKIYERGEALKAHCDKLLKNAEMRIEKITLGADGKPKGVAPLDPEG